MNSPAERLDRLYDLLPAVHKARDYELGEPLHALLQVIAEQVNVVENDIAGLYENWFIETCDDWVVPYIADLIGYEPVHDAGEPGDVASVEARKRNAILIPRREVANIIRYRRRKGTLALLELLARDVAGWPARAVEFYRLLAINQSLNHFQPKRGYTVDLHALDTLDRLGGFFDELPHTVDVHRISAGGDRGRFNVASVGLFVWRLKAYSVTQAPALCIDRAGPHCYTFSVLGNNTPLFMRASDESDPSAIAGEQDVPAPIRRGFFEVASIVDGHVVRSASPAAYGVLADGLTGNSLAIWADNWPTPTAASTKPIPPSSIIPADLADWSFVPPRDRVAVDPILGRFAFPPRQLPKGHVSVSYHYGFSADMGGGEYERPLSEPEGAEFRRVIGQDELHDELEPWRANSDGAPKPNQPQHAVIEIGDSGSYRMGMSIALAEGRSLQIRAAQGTRPVIRLLDRQTDQYDAIKVSGERGSHFTLDGLLVSGRGIEVTGTLGTDQPDRGNLASLTVRHSTLVPGWSLEPDCEPLRPSEPSIEVVNSDGCIVIDHSIVGSIQVNNEQVMSDPIIIRVNDSIVDATGTDCDSPECEAIGAVGSERAQANVEIVRSTIIGRVMVHAITLAENSIFMGPVTVVRRQLGCMRFCYVPPHSRTPRRHHCQPDLIEAAVTEDAAESTESKQARVRPRFTSTRYGTIGYCQLAQHCAIEITRGADDESEMGAFHDLFQPQRMANLRTRLNEYVPAAADVGIIVAS